MYLYERGVFLKIKLRVNNGRTNAVIRLYMVECTWPLYMLGRMFIFCHRELMCNKMQAKLQTDVRCDRRNGRRRCCHRWERTGSVSFVARKRAWRDEVERLNQAFIVPLKQTKLKLNCHLPVTELLQVKLQKGKTVTKSYF